MNDPKVPGRTVISVKKRPSEAGDVKRDIPIKTVTVLRPSRPAEELSASLTNKQVETSHTQNVNSRTSAGVPWQDLERIVRAGAEGKFGARARAETIAGVKCDCVIDLNDGSVVLIEISKENSLEKLRTDLAKFNALRPFYFGKNIFPKCYFISEENPTDALIESGKANHVQVQSIWQFLNYLFGSDRYSTIRKSLPFGSAVDIYSGQPDRTKYVKVSYFDDNGDPYSTEKIAQALIQNKTIVLIGDYGSGKSRCVKEVFDVLQDMQKTSYRHSIAINLRDNWGLKRASEIITRHFTEMGLESQVSDTLKVAYSPSAIYLLDGFDEIGAQTWSDDSTKLVAIRQQSLVGVKDLIDRTQGGVLITGREHYFNNDAELLKCLGLDKKNPLFLRCNQELSDEQFAQMIDRESPEFPIWMPKKPLIATIIRDIEASIVNPIMSTASGQIDFWNLLIDTFCEREANINPILDSEIIRALYTKIGRLSRTTQTALGPISIKQINEAFEETTGRPPTDESAIILQRLPGLGRIGAESLDRQFVDSYILDGLKAEDTLMLLAQASGEWLDAPWKNPVEAFGAFYIATRMGATKQAKSVCSFVQRNVDRKNKVFLSDVLMGLFYLEHDTDLDLGAMNFRGGRFYHVGLGDTKVCNIKIIDSSFDFLDLTDAEPKAINIIESTITKISGVTSKEHLPPWISNCLVDDFQSLKTLAAIREAGLTLAQTFLMSSLRKLFLQPGGGRRESSMYKGYGDSTAKKVCEKVISLLLKEGFCGNFKGASETLYVPNRSLRGRVQAIMSQLTTSKDSLWIEASRIV